MCADNIIRFSLANIFELHEIYVVKYGVCAVLIFYVNLMKDIIKILFTLFIVTILLTIFPITIRKSSEKLNIYTWYGTIPKEVFDAFEQETGIKVTRSFYDSNEILEANIITGNSGYDLVFPSFVPYGARQSKAGIYQPIQIERLSNAKHLSTFITKKFVDIGGDINHIVPLFYTIIGILYNVDIVKNVFGSTEVSYSSLFEVDNIKKLQPYGVNFPSEYIDVFPQLQKYLCAYSNDRIQNAVQCLRRINIVKPYVKKFFSSTILNEFMCCETAIAICSSDNAWKLKKCNQNVAFLADNEYGLVAIECVAIPKGSRNIDNAYKFIDYILRPDISKIIMEHSGLLVNTDTNISNNVMFPMSQIASFLFLKPSITANDIYCDKVCMQMWTQVINSNKSMESYLDALSNTMDNSMGYHSHVTRLM